MTTKGSAEALRTDGVDFTDYEPYCMTNFKNWLGSL